ncbi:MAG: hypothetical protein C5B59_14400 [Bacteroidetes bacterium]|nr:MAG: hypothetical protein C5B59_14400 [Bacteroidota bacterium]
MDTNGCECVQALNHDKRLIEREFSQSVRLSTTLYKMAEKDFHGGNSSHTLQMEAVAGPGTGRSARAHRDANPKNSKSSSETGKFLSH